jgi:hypothetical protein
MNGSTFVALLRRIGAFIMRHDSCLKTKIKEILTTPFKMLGICLHYTVFILYNLYNWLAKIFVLYSEYNFATKNRRHITDQYMLFILTTVRIF